MYFKDVICILDFFGISGMGQINKIVENVVEAFGLLWCSGIGRKKVVKK